MVIVSERFFFCYNVRSVGVHTDDNDYHIVIPRTNRRQDVYREYLKHKRITEQDPIAKSTFLMMWRANHPRIRLAGSASSFTKCDICEEFKNRIESCPCRQEFEALCEQRAAHNYKQGKDRQKYKKHRCKAFDDSDKYLSVIMDGMDQSKTSLPKPRSFSKTQANIEILKQKLHGSIAHSYGPFVHTAVHPLITGGNFTVECLWRTLRGVARIRTERGQKALPNVLYLQLDNARDGKNKTLLAYCHYLVFTGVFEKVSSSSWDSCTTYMYTGQSIVFNAWSHT